MTFDLPIADVSAVDPSLFAIRRSNLRYEPTAVSRVGNVVSLDYSASAGAWVGANQITYAWDAPENSMYGTSGVLVQSFEIAT